MCKIIYKPANRPWKLSEVARMVVVSHFLWHLEQVGASALQLGSQLTSFDFQKYFWARLGNMIGQVVNKDYCVQLWDSNTKIELSLKIFCKLWDRVDVADKALCRGRSWLRSMSATPWHLRLCKSTDKDTHIFDFLWFDSFYRVVLVHNKGIFGAGSL